MNLHQINPADTVATDLDTGHKVALRDIAAGENIIKYGFPIGYATRDIKKGEHVHTENLATNLKDKLEYEYCPTGTNDGPSRASGTAKSSGVPEALEGPQQKGTTILAYPRANGDIGIRNDIWIINTVGCVNKLAEKLAAATGAFCFTHPYGCSQLGGDHLTTQKILRGLVNHPNAGGVLVLGLGCENNNINEFKKILEEAGPINTERVKFMNAQDYDDDFAQGIKLIKELQAYAATFKREPVSISKLKVGLKCGGSDGFSGITANPLIGQFSDLLTSAGGTTVLTEVPEMFGAETILMNRCKDRATFEKTVALINNFKDYFTKHNQVVYENPSPGNKAGGITTLEEKSLGCVQKGGTSAVVDVLDSGDTLSQKGLNLLNGPGNDIVAVTNLTAAGCHLILFSTGRGTPLGAPVPTIKIATNKTLAQHKSNWIDFDASPILQGKNLSEDFFNYVISIAEGSQTKNEINGYREIAIFKEGVTL